MVLVCVSLMTDGVEQLFFTDEASVCLIGKMSIQMLPPF